MTTTNHNTETPSMQTTLMSAAPQPVPNEREIVITRIFDAPRELVWKAWTDPKHVMRWWGPKNFTSPVCKIDLRVGGSYLYCMRSPEGQDFWSTGVYREITEPERIVCTDSFADAGGNVVPASHYGMGGDWPIEMLVTATFEEHEGKTKLTLTHVGVPAGQMRELTEAGWKESFDKLTATLSNQKGETARTKTNIIAEPGKQEIVITRIFDAPRDLVFKTMTDPNLIPQWWGPKRLKTTVDKMDMRPGGVWRFAHRDDEGNEFGFNGVYREIVPPERLVYTFEFEGMPGHVSLETVTFEEHDGKTKLTNVVTFDSVEDRDGMFQSGMETGAIETMDRLDELLARV